MRDLFARKLISECSWAALGVFAILFGIVTTAMFVRLLGRAVSGALAPDAVVAAMSFQVLNLMPVIVALTVFVAVLIAVSRAYRDSEMVVWLSCGVPLHRFLLPLLGFAAPFVVLIALLTIFVRPWAVTRSQEMEAEIKSRDEITAVAPGVFKETRGGDRVYFVERFGGLGESLAGVFIRSEEKERVSITVAREGTVEKAPNGDRFLILRDGRRYEGTPGTAAYRVTRFAQTDLRIEPYEKQENGSSPKARATTDLLSSDRRADLAEFQWRLQLPIAAALLVALALPLGYANVRAGRSSNLVLAVLVYAVYSNLLSISNAWVAAGRVGTWVGFFGVHVLLLAVIAAAVAWQGGWVERWRAAR